MSGPMMQTADALAWERALDRVEADILRAEALVAGATAVGLEPWTAPKLNGPLPEVLRTRARDLHARQEQVLRQLSAAALRTRRQLDVTRKIGDATGFSKSVPVYVDATA